MLHVTFGQLQSRRKRHEVAEMRSDSNFALVDRALLMTVDANGTGAAIVDLARAEGKRGILDVDLTLVASDGRAHWSLR
jgi:hypothetical protein